MSNTKDLMHGANHHVTHPDATELGAATAREIDAHPEETWTAAYEHAAHMVQNGWDIDTAALSASDKFNVPRRPITVLLCAEMAS
jgi:hypothetical protein